MEGGNGVMMKEDKEQLTNLLERFSPDVESVKQICQQSNSQSLHEPELNLQLSLGINFEGETHLTRASSVAELMTQRKGSGEGEGEVFSFERSCSLPAERKQEHGHGLITLRELQARRRMRAMRRMKAKNRLLERQRISKENKEKEKSKASLKEPMPPLPAAEMATWAPSSLAKTPLPYQATVNIKAKGDLAESKKGMYFPPPSLAPASAHGRKGSAAPNQPKLHKYPTGPEGSAAPNQPSKFHPSLDQRNIEPIQPSKFHPPADPRKVVPNQPSRFHSSSDPRNIETNQTSRFHPPSDQSNIERNQSSKFHPPSDPRNVVTNQLSRFHSSSDPRNIETNQTSRFHQPSDPRCIEPMTSPGTTLNGMLVQPAEAKPENQCKWPGIISGNFEHNGIDVMKLMPSVTTTGDGPNGKRIEGFLYTYTKDQVCIVCICHGSFLSPAEFVKHAGGKDVQNPMKHITVHSALSAQGQR